ncbi:MAG TPA: flippase-like domain-containing protein [Candidatus Binatia bacterium]|nr:flippase-like domain-containing protein [Candidatus Binatia bacterium]
MRTVPKKRLALQLAAALAGLGLLGLLVWNVGIGELVEHLRRIGWLAPLLLAPYSVIALCDAKGWACAIPAAVQAGKIPLWRLSLARIAGEAVNNLTPTANLGGEPIKVYLLRTHGLTIDSGLASVVVAKTTLVVSQIVFILLGFPFFLYRLGWVRQGWWVLGPLLVLAYGFAILLIRWQRRGLMGMAVRTLQRLLPRWQRLAHWEERAQRIDGHLLGFYDGNTRGFIASTVYHFLGWLLGAAEVQFFFYLMGVPVAPIDALIIETMVQPLTVAALVIPGALGVQEAGGVFLCRLLGLGDGAGLTLMALKRVREGIYNLIGLFVLARVSGVLFPQKLTRYRTTTSPR